MLPKLMLGATGLLGAAMILLRRKRPASQGTTAADQRDMERWRAAMRRGRARRRKTAP
jgi:hypothetical protein